MMSPAEILGRLDQRFRLLTGGSRTALERHQTLRAAIDWSYEILDADERALLNRLSVFVGGFDLDAATALATGAGLDDFAAVDVLGSLVAKSLVERNEASGTTRYRLLEMIRQYAAEHLDAAGDAAGARDDHARYCLTLAKALFGQLARPKTSRHSSGSRSRHPTWARPHDGSSTPTSHDLMTFFEGVAVARLRDAAVRAARRARPNRRGGSSPSGRSRTLWLRASLLLRLDVVLLHWRYRRASNLHRPRASDPGRASALPSRSTWPDNIQCGDMSTAAAIARSAVDQARERGDAIELAFTLTVFAFFETSFDETASRRPLERPSTSQERRARNRPWCTRSARWPGRHSAPNPIRRSWSAMSACASTGRSDAGGRTCAEPQPPASTCREERSPKGSPLPQRTATLRLGR